MYLITLGLQKQLQTRQYQDREVNALRGDIYDISQDTASKLKRNVYENYNRFIETAKEISGKFLTKQFFNVFFEII